MSTAETADNAGKIAEEEEPALEGSVVQEEERIHITIAGGELLLS